ncbi:N-acetylmuramoyl-L-alanine amidase [Bacteroides sedimenti]|uniref:N-acetylmuramoyl-L-alanine amidase n=1 Tax=Bacteroides sedimenti TaxID=2136147 RepID=A0ABM8I8H5_9BACE
MSCRREINLLVVHCSATRADLDFSEADLERSHRKQGFNGIGYHFYIRKDGFIASTRPVEKPGAHARGHNANSIGICYEGGLNAAGKPADTRTMWQKRSLRALVNVLHMDYPHSRVVGHRDLSPDLDGDGIIEKHEWLKQCPCFDVANEFKNLEK